MLSCFACFAAIFGGGGESRASAVKEYLDAKKKILDTAARVRYRVQYWERSRTLGALVNNEVRFVAAMFIFQVI